MLPDKIAICDTSACTFRLKLHAGVSQTPIMKLVAAAGRCHSGTPGHESARSPSAPRVNRTQLAQRNQRSQNVNLALPCGPNLDGHKYLPANAGSHSAWVVGFELNAGASCSAILATVPPLTSVGTPESRLERQAPQRLTVIVTQESRVATRRDLDVALTHATDQQVRRFPPRSLVLET